jgi:hypothetical protein
MKYYFEDENKREVLYNELESWLFTPFKHHVGVKNLGCDCIHFILRIYEAMKILPPGKIRVPKYPKDWHIHNDEELLYQNIKKFPFFEELEVVDGEPVLGVMDGDVYLHKFGLANSHSAIYCRDHIYHAITDSGVQRTQWGMDKFSKVRSCGFRTLAI